MHKNNSKYKEKEKEKRGVYLLRMAIGDIQSGVFSV